MRERSCTSKLVDPSSVGVNPLQRATIRKCFVSKFYTAWCCDAVEQLAPSEGVIRNSHHSTGHSDHPKMSAALPGFSSNCAYACFDTDMTQAWHSDKGARGNDSCQVHWNLDCLWDITIWASVEAFLRMKDSEAVPKHYGKLHVLLQ